MEIIIIVIEYEKGAIYGSAKKLESRKFQLDLYTLHKLLVSCISMNKLRADVVAYLFRDIIHLGNRLTTGMFMNRFRIRKYRTI